MATTEMNLFQGKHKLQLNAVNQHRHMFRQNSNTFPNYTTTFYKDAKSYHSLFHISNSDIGQHCQKIDFSQQGGIKSITVDFEGDHVCRWSCDIYADEDCFPPVVYEIEQARIALPEWAQNGKSMRCNF
jgi:hypothetical protein